MEDGEQLCAFLDVVPLFKVLRESLDRVAGIRLHEGKTSGDCARGHRRTGRGGMAARRFESSWHAHRPAVHRRTVARTSGRRTTLLGRLPTVKNLQCAWPLLQSASPRANHTLRTLPPSLSGRYAQDHDDSIWATVEALLQQVPSGVEEQNFAREIATLPMRMGGLGLRSATKCAAAACWASWAGRLDHDQPKKPRGSPTWWCGPWRVNCRAHKEVVWLRSSMPAPVSTAKASGGDHLGKNSAMARGHLRTPQESQESGWQYWASSVSDSYFKKTTMLSVRPAASRAHLRSGLNAAAALAFAPTAPEYVIPTHLFRVLLLGSNSRSL